MSSALTEAFLLFLFLTFTSHSEARLRIISPEFLTRDDRFNSIDYAILNQLIPRGSFRGTLIVYNYNKHTCRPLNTRGIHNPIIFADWGECSLAQKINNAEVAGAKMLILVLGADMSLDDPSLKGFRITSNIEVVIITKKDNDDVIQGIRVAGFHGYGDPKSFTQVDYFSDPDKNIHKNKEVPDHAALDYYFTPNDDSRLAYEFLAEMKDVLSSEVRGIFQFYPHYILHVNEEIARGGDLRYNGICVLGGGRYCDPYLNNFGGKRLYGNDTVLEILRQICLRDLKEDSQNNQSNPDTYWWKYMNAWINECVDNDFKANPNCHEIAFRAANISQAVIDEVNTCMRESFEVFSYENSGMTLEDNSKLRAEVAAAGTLQVSTFPSLYVNGIEYRGSLRNGGRLVDFVCSDLSSKGRNYDECFKRQYRFSVYKENVPVLLASVLGTLFAMALIVYCMGRSAKREIMAQANREIPLIAAHMFDYDSLKNLQD